MDESDQPTSWIEGPDGKRTPLIGSCFFGRARTSTIVLADDNVSRRHAMVHAPSEREYYLIDLGSANGTYLNGRRITQSTRLADGDRIGVGQYVFVFRTGIARDPHTGDMSTEKTIQDIRSVPCWLLVADIEGSTALARQAPADEITKLTGNWLAECKGLVEQYEGSVNKFLGDGFLAYWKGTKEVAKPVFGALDAFKKMQGDGPVRFRIVLHHGDVFVGGGASLGEESLLGPQVNFVFRMEKVAGSVGESRMTSHAARELLGELLTVVETYKKGVPGFEGEFTLHSF